MNWYKISQNIIEDYISLKQAILPLRTELAFAAQKVYNDWNVVEGEEDFLNGGGICQDIAEAMCGVINQKFPQITCSTMDASVGDQHVFSIAYLPEDTQGYVVIDISPYLYETGGGYSWKKIPNVVFDANDVSVTAHRGNANVENY